MPCTNITYLSTEIVLRKLNKEYFFIISSSKRWNKCSNLDNTKPRHDSLIQKKVDVMKIETTHLGRVSIGIEEGQETDYKAMKKGLIPSFIHSHDVAVLKSSFQDWQQSIDLSQA